MKRTLLAVAVGLLAACPVSAQPWGWYAGPAIGWVDGDISDEPIAGFDVGVSFQDFAICPDVRVEVRYVHRKTGDIDDPDRLHTFQIPVLYKAWFDDIHYALVGPAVSYFRYYDENITDLSVMAGVGVDIARGETRTIGLEAVYNLGLPFAVVGWEFFAPVGSLQGLSLRLTVRGR